MNWRPVVLVLAAIALVGMIYYGIKKSSSLPEGYSFEAREQTAAGPTVPSVGTGQAAAPALKTIGGKPAGVAEDSEEKPFIYSSKKVRNPMAPLLAKPEKTVAQMAPGQPKAAPTTVRHRLEGIIWSDVSPYAIIDGNAMGIGEKLRDGSSVAEIGKDFVVLKREGATSRLVLK